VFVCGQHLDIKEEYESIAGQVQQLEQARSASKGAKSDSKARATAAAGAGAVTGAAAQQQLARLQKQLQVGRSALLCTSPS
jgi:hypothetical protein